MNALMENYPKVRNMAKIWLPDRSDVPTRCNVADFVDHIDYMVN